MIRIKLIVGLGNPGYEYENTRHNVGFMVLDAYAKSHNITFANTKFDGLYAEYNMNGEKIIFLKPLRYMNLSGEVIKMYVDYFKISIDDILIIHDDMDLELGKMKLRYKGGTAGHNGLKNIEFNLKTSNYKRIKVGIAKDKKEDTINYVLGKFTKEQLAILNETISKIINVIDDFPGITFENLMNKYN